MVEIDAEGVFGKKGDHDDCLSVLDARPDADAPQNDPELTDGQIHMGIQCGECAQRSHDIGRRGNHIAHITRITFNVCR